MLPEKIYNKGNARLFKSDFLEAMSRTHPFVIYSIYFPVIGWLLYYGNVHLGVDGWTEVALFIGGAFFWSFFEYIMHRFLFHMIPHNARTEKFVHTMHGVHHEYPRDRGRLFMPPIPSLFVSSILYLVFTTLMGKYAYSFFPGFLLGYLIYGSMHYAIHAFAPPKFMKALWRNHHMHHYKTPHKAYGVSSVFWDIIFGTMPDKKEAIKAHSSGAVQ